MSKLRLESEIRSDLRKTIMVGYDGSNLALQAVSIAAAMMHETKDQLLILTLGREGKDEDAYKHFKDDAVEEAKKWRVLPKHIFSEFKRLDDTWTYAQALMYIANHLDNGAATLVVGAVGKGDEERRHGRRPEGQLPMGKMAIELLNKTKVPVMLIKSDTGIQLPGPERKISKPPRVGRSGASGYRWLIPLDPSAACEMAFDKLVLYAQAQDSIFGFHVRAAEPVLPPPSMSTSKRQVSDSLVAKYREALDKVVASGGVREAEVVIQPHSLSVKDAILAFADQHAVDFIVSGAVELELRPRLRTRLSRARTSPNLTSLTHTLTIT